jgi:hypothetical protein
MIRITAACPETLIADANHLAMCLAHGPADGDTYRSPCWQDADGHLYAAASFEVRSEWIMSAQSPLVRPEWDTDEIVGMAAAARAQAALVFALEPTPAAPGQITAIGGMDGVDALVAMGLTPVAQDDDP